MTIRMHYRNRTNNPQPVWRSAARKIIKVHGFRPTKKPEKKMKPGPPNHEQTLRPKSATYGVHQIRRFTPIRTSG